MKKINKHFLLLVILIFSSGTYSFAQKSKQVADSLKLILSTTTTDTGRITLLNLIAYEYVTDDPDQATKLATEALVLSEKINSDVGRLNCYNDLGLSLYYQNKYDEALEYYKKSLVLCKKLNNQIKLAVTLNNIGLVYDDKGDYKKALEYYLNSLKFSDEVGGSKWQMASSLNNVGLIYKNLGQYDKALEYYNKSLKIKEGIGNQKGMASSYLNIATVYKVKGEYEKSLLYNNKALEIRKKFNDISGTALSLNNIGSVYESMGQFDKAFPYFVEALKIRKDSKDNYNHSVSLYSLGANYCNRKKFEEGINYLEEALTLAKQLGAKDLLKYGYEELAEVYAQQKKFAKAFEYQKKLISVKDSILNLESNSQLNEMQTKYESEKKEKEIELLTKDSEIQSLQLNKNKLWLIVLFSMILLVLTFTALVFNRYKIKKKANHLLEHRNSEITQQKKEITDSINYAKRIQESILPPTEHWQKILSNSFIFYRPKDIVSGDFYWIEQKNDIVCFAAVDCTGHGVPGALMSVVGFNLLTQAVNEVGLTKPSEILKHLDAGVTKTLRQSEDGKGVKDGMDLSLCSLNLVTNELQYAGAFNSLYYISSGVFNEIKADKFPIGVNLDGKVDEYRNHSIQLKKGDSLFLYSDGYADQFGGPNGKKFKYNKLKQLLIEISVYPVSQQKQAVEQAFDMWKGKLEQVDDVVIIGVKI